MCRIFLSLILLPFFTSFAEEKPNILFLFADDQCFRTIGSLNNPEVETPNLDRLVANGTTFTHAYNMGSWSGAVCLASRQMLNTGEFVWKAKAVSDDSNKTRLEKRQTWGQLMTDAGYDTYMTGKWHVKASPEDMFATVSNPRPGMPNQTPTGYGRPLADGTDPWDPADPSFEGFWKGGTHWSTITANDAISFLKTAKGKKDPFFIYCAFNAPHDPRQAPQEYLDKYPAKDIAVPENYLDIYPYAEEMKSGRGLRDEKLAPFPRTEAIVQVHRREYYALITHMDNEIGRILDELEASGKADNTYIFFSADHGLGVGEHGLLGKQNMFDHSVRVPLLVNGPGVKAGAKNHSKVYLQDIMATSLELGKAKRPSHVQFKSLKPMLDGKKGGYSSIYGAYLDAQRAVTTGHHKLILYPQVPVALLFDLKKDPNETKDLLENPENLPLAKKLFGDLLKLQEETGDELDLKAVYPELLR